MARGARVRGGTKFGLNGRGEPVDEALRGFLKLLLEKSPFRLRAFVVFGSRARGDWKPWSDTDVLLVMDGVQGKSMQEVVGELREVWEGLSLLPPAGIEPRIFAPEEALELLHKRASLTILDALEDGIALYDDGFWAGLKREFERMKEEGLVRRTRGGWEVRKPR